MITGGVQSWVSADDAVFDTEDVLGAMGVPSLRDPN